MQSDRVPENPPAFPLHTPDGPRFHQDVEPGMTLRDWFAGQALAGMLASIQRDYSGEARLDSGNFAGGAYLLADAMLLARTGAQS